MKVRNTFIIFIVSGFWHGANWTFIIWGALNAVYFLPLLLTNSNRNNIEIIAKNRYLPKPNEAFQMLVTFGLTVFAWIFFRAENISHAISYISGILSVSLFAIPDFSDMRMALATIILTGFMLLVEWHGRRSKYAIEHLGLKWNPKLRYSLYYMLLIAIFWFGGEEQEFIYFQF